MMITNIVEKETENVAKFANIIGSLQEKFLDKLNIDMFELFYNNHKFRNDFKLASRFVAICSRIFEVSEGIEIPPKRASESIIKKNKLGPIFFFTPELGRWSTVGGLGVMVDELA